MPLEMETAESPHALSRHDDDDSVVGLGVPHGDEPDAFLDRQREEALMDEMIMKHRSEFQTLLARTMDANVAAVTGNDKGEFRGADHQDDLQNIPSSPTRDRPRFDPNFRTPQPKRSSTSERLSQLSRTERTDRMRLAELSDVRNEKLARDAIRRWNPNAKETRNGLKPRERALTSPPVTTARMLGEYSKDYVQQAIDFSNLTDEDDDHVGAEDDDDDHDLDDDDDIGPPLQSDLDDMIDHQLRGPLSAKKMRKYVKHVKHMETTIAQLVQQKEELIRNQAEFDKHASGMFPTLENINDQLSQIVQDRLLQSQVNMKDDLEGELRGLRVRLNELEAEARQRRNDAELQEQKSQIDISQIKTEVASLGTTSSLQDQKMELLSSQIKQLRQEIQQAVELTRSLSSQYQVIDKRITTVHTAVQESRSQSIATTKSGLGAVAWVALVVVAVAVLLGVMTTDRCSGWFGRCRPLT